MLVLTKINETKFSHRKTWDCDTCIADVQALSRIGQSDQAGQNIVSVLQGPAFCQDPDLALTPDQVTKCQMYVKPVDAAFGVVFKMVGDQAKDFCADVYQICQYW